MKDFNIQCVCYSCESLLLVEREDIVAKIEKDLKFYYTFKCPCCNIENKISSIYIPFNVRTLALKKYRMNILKGISVYEGINV